MSEITTIGENMLDILSREGIEIDFVKYITSEEEYREYEAINFSLLSRVDSSYGVPLNMVESIKGSPGVEFGSLVDLMALTPSKFRDRVYVLKAKKPTGQMGEFVEQLFKVETDISIFSEESKVILNPAANFTTCAKAAYEVVGFKRDSFDKVLERFNEEGNEYFEALVESKDKIIISPERLTEIEEAVQRLQSSQIWKEIYSEGSIVTTQLGIVFKISIPGYSEPFTCKSLLDIYKSEGGVTEPVDLKTMSKPISTFKEGSFLRFRYYLQAALYSLAVLSASKNMYPFSFLVLSSLKNNEPMRFYTTLKDFEVGLLGGTTVNGQQVKGIMQLLQELVAMEETGQTAFPAQVYKQQYDTLDVFK